MYLGYFDEFGHNGAFISRHHPKYNTHPVFGIGGFIIPADNVRQLSGVFATLKRRGSKKGSMRKLLPRESRLSIGRRRAPHYSRLTMSANTAKSGAW
ncbi:DUF3800 domain-containing protein [Corynebacterium glaucum]|uniref:DUF3800 domain-containing protein n=1 Tax=Corynebacterium glaucum TaxID=187491 RepID=UPI0039F5353E